MLKRMTYPTQERLKEVFDYFPETGIFIRKPKPGKRNIQTGRKVGTIHEDGYEYFGVDYKIYLAHRLAWLYMTGEVPDYLDHKNGIKSDNRFKNLRLATQAQNQLNHRKTCRNKSGIKGVCWVKRYSRWVAQASLNGKYNWLGSFKTIEEAEACVRAFREIHHGEFANHG